MSLFRLTKNPSAAIFSEGLTRTDATTRAVDPDLYAAEGHQSGGEALSTSYIDSRHVTAVTVLGCSTL